MNQHTREVFWGFVWAALLALPAAIVAEILLNYWHSGAWHVWILHWHTFWDPQMVQLTEMWAGTTIFIIVVKSWRKKKFTLF